ncbi:MAG: hypothetical protein Q8O00_06980, partial [Holophaga sp.]|nr:hypothetical protein [Holophaga sp.]
MTSLKYVLAMAGITLAAQANPDVLAHLSAKAKSYTYYPNPAVSRSAFLATTRLFTKAGKDESLLGKSFGTDWGLSLDAFDGGVLLVEFAGAPGEPKRLLALGTAKPLDTLKRLKARKDGEGWSYRLPDGEERFGVLRQGVLLLSDRRELLEAPAAVEDLAALRPWMSGLDMVLGTTRSQLAEGLTQAKQGMAALQSLPDQPQKEGEENPKADAANLAMLKPVFQMLEPFVTNLQASADTAALGVGFRPEGVHMKAQVFFKPGSPLAADASSVSAGSRLHGLTGMDHITAGGFSGAAMAPLASFGTVMIRNMVGKTADPDLLKRWEASQEITSKGLQNIAWSLAMPTKPGAPWLTGIHAVMKVADARAHLAAMAEGQELSIQLLKAMPKETRFSLPTTVQRDILPGVPSLGVSMDLSGLMAEKGMPPQAGSAMTMMLGGPNFQMSYGLLDNTTLAMTVGDANVLKDALVRLKSGQLLEQQPAVRKALGMLPTGAIYQMLLSPGGFTQAAKTLMANLGGGQKVAFPVCSDS